MMTALMTLCVVGQASTPSADPHATSPTTHGPASVPASQPSLSSDGHGSDVQGDATVIYEIDEFQLKTQESWTLANSSGKLIDSSELVFDVPNGTRLFRLDEDVQGFKAQDDGSRFFATEPLKGGTTVVSGAYLTGFNGDSVTVRRSTPVNLRTLRLIIQNVSGLKFSSPLPHDRRMADLNGLEFAIFTLGPIPAGSSIAFTLEGLPTHSTLPAYLALALCVGVVGWMLYALSQPRSRPMRTMGVLSAEARRDRLIKALELLDRDKAEDKIKPRRYAQRYDELMNELADVLREVDRVGPSSRREAKESP